MNGWANFFLVLRFIPGDGAGDQSEFTLPFTQEMMSAALGLSVPHLNRTLTRLWADGLIAVNERRVEFIDPKSMALLAQFQPINPGRIPICGGN